MADTLERLRVALADRYRLERELGQGGMAVVYLAHDLKHGRQVAIKTLRPELAVAVGAERFLREIEIAARLQHPHILPVYDSGQADGVLYYVMPFVEGESLRDRLDREKRVAVADAVQIAAEVADALSYAHGRGLVHRDIKPENILMSGGHAVVADFGIATAVSAAGSERLTQTGMAVGSPAYMSPEQATAGPLDGRSDVYSLGCVLFEMLAGQPPFTGPTLHAIIAQSITGPRPRLKKVNPDVPDAIDEIVAGALAQNPEQRCASAADFAGALRGMTRFRRPLRERRQVVLLGLGALVVAVALGAWSLLRARSPGRSVTAGADVVAVMPFSTSGPGLDYLREGMVDLLSKNLDAVGAIRAVDPRAVLARVKKRSKDGIIDRDGAIAVGRDVKAGSVLMGSVVAAGSGARLDAELYDLSGTRIAEAQVDGPVEHLLALADSLSLKLLHDVWQSHAPIPEPRAASITSSSFPAIRAYLQGEQLYRRAQWDSAVTAYSDALQADSTFALAAFRAALAYGWSEGAGSANLNRDVDISERFASRLSPRDRALSHIYALFERHHDLTAVDSARAYVARYPDDADGWYLLGDAQFHARAAIALSPEAARQPFERVVALDSSLAPPAMIHPMESAMLTGDSVAFGRYYHAFVAASGPAPAAEYLMASRAVWGPVDSLLPYIHLLSHEPHGGARIQLALIALARMPNVDPDRLVQAADTMLHVLAPNAAANSDLALTPWLLRLGLGRVKEIAAYRERVRSVRGGEDAAIFLSIHAEATGETDSGFASQFRPLLAHLPARAAMDQFFRAEDALARRRPGDALAAIGPALADSVALPPMPLSMLRMAEAWVDLERGDTSAADRQLSAALRIGAYFGGPSGPARLRLAEALAGRPETRARAIDMLRYDFDNNPDVLPLTYRALGHALEAQGDSAGAVLAYDQFIRLWAKADPELQPLVADARAAMGRLAKGK